MKLKGNWGLKHTMYLPLKMVSEVELETCSIRLSLDIVRPLGRLHSESYLHGKIK